VYAYVSVSLDLCVGLFAYLSHMCEWCVPVSCHPFAARKETIESIKGEHKKKGEKSTYTMKRKPKWRYPPRAKRRPIQHKTEDNNKTQRNRTGTDGDQEEGRRGERPNAGRPCEARRGKRERGKGEREGERTGGREGGREGGRRHTPAPKQSKVQSNGSQASCHHHNHQYQ